MNLHHAWRRSAAHNPLLCHQSEHCSDCSFHDLIIDTASVEAAGGVGVIFIGTDDELFTIGGEEGDEDVSIPVVGLRQSDGSPLVARDGFGLTVTFDYNWDDSESESDEDSEGDQNEERGGGSLVDRDDLLAAIRVTAGCLTGTRPTRN